MSNSVEVYNKGNDWQKNRYAFMSEYNRKAGITEFGCAKEGTTPYYHLLTEKDKLHNFLMEQSILDAVEERFGKKAGDKPRVLTNTVASQPCCFNLFVPLRRNKKLAGKIFSELLNEEVQIKDIVIEFTPATSGRYGDQSIGDQSDNSGTDSDVAVFYSTGKRKGVILIEFKYIESEFSTCSSVRRKEKKHLKQVCTKQGFYHKLIEQQLEYKPSRPDCGYLKYNNWQLTKVSKAIDFAKVKEHDGCPFINSGQQLWRNILLAENVKRCRKIDELQFWVLAPSENTFLWKADGLDVESEFRSVLTPLGNSAFRKLDLRNDFFNLLKSAENDNWTNEWIRKFEERHLTATTI